MVLGYSVKSKGIAKDIFGEEKIGFGIDEISDAGKLIAKFEEMKNEEDSIKEILKNKIQKLKKCLKSENIFSRSLVMKKTTFVISKFKIGRAEKAM